MAGLVRSSGDVSLDRQYDFVEMLMDQGDPVAALDLVRSIVSRAPDWVFGWFRMGQVAHAAGDTDTAIAAWRHVLTLDPSDQCGAAVMLGVIGADQIEQMPTAFVETLFDQYADRFDQSLVTKLNYTVPERLGLAVCELHPDRFSAALDLGCGTGLAGGVFRPVVDHLSGLDLSAAMLAKAQSRGIYDSLSKADILQLPLLTRPAYDLIIAADVLIYLGALDQVVAWAKSALCDQGLFAFSVEQAPEGGAYILGQERRFKHSKAYLEHQLGASGFVILDLSPHVLRQDRGQDVQGYICIAKRVVATLGAVVMHELAPTSDIDVVERFDA